MALNDQADVIVSLALRSARKVAAMEAPKSSELVTGPKPEVIYRCKKCRRMLALQKHVVPHQHGGGWRGASKPMRRRAILDKERPQCSGSSMFVEPLKWMESCEFTIYKTVPWRATLNAQVATSAWVPSVGMACCATVEHGLIPHFSCIKKELTNVGELVSPS
ncbi:hypothetical protein RJ639_047528 [Escallonia herrerae]|uniref:Uncharacterized protein n=1 Tax=Escallonia herrerae TaxID=1293975 RepID=A0AA89B443_9ASTE|nr:hypothetical protein RJ639_047528 [Escallonia herrerae]